MTICSSVNRVFFMAPSVAEGAIRSSFSWSENRRAGQMADRLTTKQQRLVDELRAISERIGVDYWNIRTRERAARTPVLEVMRRELVRGAIVSEYTLIDEHLAMKLCQYFFPGQDFQKLWKTQRFQRFNYYVLEKLYLIHKLALVKDVYQVPKGIASTIEEINALRNSVAHAFFPENLRAYRETGRPTERRVLFKGVDVFTSAGLSRFLDETAKVIHFMIWDIRRKKRVKKLTPEAIQNIQSVGTSFNP